MTTLRALEEIESAQPAATPAELVHMAAGAATDLRQLVAKLSDAKGRSAVAELQRQAGAILHDTTLQTLEYLAADGYGAELDAAEVRRIAGEAAEELRADLFRIGTDESCELVSGLRRVVSEAQRRGVAEDIHLDVGELEGEMEGDEAAAIVAAVREALNNVRKHAHASSVVVRCEGTADGARVTVRDDGVGADLDHLASGIGLRHSIQERMARHGGRADLDSAPGAGMLVTLSTAGAEEKAA